jgi:hypothetical protein
MTGSPQESDAMMKIEQALNGADVEYFKSLLKSAMAMD